MYVEIVRICLLPHLEKMGFKMNWFHNLWPTSPEESNYSSDQMNVGLYNHSQWPKQCPRTPVIHITKQWHTFGIPPFVDVVTAVSMTGEAITSADPVVKCASVYLCTFQCKQTGSKGIRLTVSHVCSRGLTWLVKMLLNMKNTWRILLWVILTLIETID